MYPRMDIDKDLDRMIEADLEHWQEREHQAVFSFEDADGAAGELYVDGLPVRVSVSGQSAWVSLEEAQYVAMRLGVTLLIA